MTPSGHCKIYIYYYWITLQKFHPLNCSFAALPFEQIYTFFYVGATKSEYLKPKKCGQTVKKNTSKIFQHKFLPYSKNDLLYIKKMQILNTSYEFN